MISLKPIVPGQPEATSNDHAQCGKLAAEAVLRTLGWSVAVGAPDGATAAQLVTAIHAAAPAANVRAVYDLPSRVIAAALAAGEYVIVGVFCTPDAQPVPKALASATHWVDAWSTNDDYYNPWLARQERANLDAAYGGFGNVIVGGATAPPVQGENEMAMVKNANGSIGVFARSANGHIYQWWQDAAGWHGPADVTAATNPPLAISGEPSAVATGGADDVTVGFRAAADGKLYVVWMASGHWYGPAQIPGQ